MKIEDSVSMEPLRTGNRCSYRVQNKPCQKIGTVRVHLAYCSLTLDEASPYGPFSHEPHPNSPCPDGGTSYPEETVVCEAHAQLMRATWSNVARMHTLEV